jgi:hypothetical protein
VAVDDGSCNLTCVHKTIPSGDKARLRKRVKEDKKRGGGDSAPQGTAPSGEKEAAIRIGLCAVGPSVASVGRTHATRLRLLLPIYIAPQLHAEENVLDPGAATHSHVVRIISIATGPLVIPDVEDLPA